MAVIRRSSSLQGGRTSSSNRTGIILCGGVLMLIVALIFFLDYSSSNDITASSALLMESANSALNSLPIQQQSETTLKQQQQESQRSFSTSTSSTLSNPLSWKLWHEMNPSEQRAAMERLTPWVQKYGALVGSSPGKPQKHGPCEMVPFKNGHDLCGPPPPTPCTFFSFGINDDPSFDIALAERWKCRGFAADPTVDHPSKLHPLVTFHNIGLTMLSDNEERIIDKGGTEDWWFASVPGLAKLLKVDHLNVLKIDCEGCEIAFTRDILAEDPLFLHKVDQLSMETHVTKTWINSTEAAYYFGLQFPLLEQAGFRMEWSSIFGCSKRHEITGCMPIFEGESDGVNDKDPATQGMNWKFPCGHKPWPGHPNVVRGRSCHEYTWKRYPDAASRPPAPPFLTSEDERIAKPGLM